MKSVTITATGPGLDWSPVAQRQAGRDLRHSVRTAPPNAVEPAEAVSRQEPGPSISLPAPKPFLADSSRSQSSPRSASFTPNRCVPCVQLTFPKWRVRIRSGRLLWSTTSGQLGEAGSECGQAGVRSLRKARHCCWQLSVAEDLVASNGVRTSAGAATSSGDACIRFGAAACFGSGALVLSCRTRSKIRVAKGIRPARMIATQSGSIFIQATL